MGAVHHTTGRLETFAGYAQLEVEICTCGVLFAAPEHLLDSKRRNGQTFYCPNGHSLTYNSSDQKLKRELARERERAGRLAAERDQAQASARAEKAAKTRIKNQRDRERTRVGHGVCPCCNRSFTNLRRHMESQHPDHAHDHGAV